MTDDRATSITLLDQIRSGDQAAWHRTVHLYRPLIIYWCRKGGGGADADDLAQEVLFAATQGIGGFRKEAPGDSFRGWLRGVTRHKLLEWHRRHGRQVAEAAGGTVAGQVLGAQPDPLVEVDDDPGERHEARAVYLRALELVKAEFEERTWRAFWRVTVDGADTAEVARDHGVSAAAIRLAKSRVLRRLKEVVGDMVD